MGFLQAARQNTNIANIEKKGGFEVTTGRYLISNNTLIGTYK
jgi:hypothetical protein